MRPPGQLVEHGEVLGEAERVGERERARCSVEIRIRSVTAAAAPATGTKVGQVAVLDEVVLAEPHLVEPELVEQRDLLDRLGVDVLQRVIGCRAGSGSRARPRISLPVS